MAVAAPQAGTVKDNPIAPWWFTLLAGISLVIIGILLWMQPLATSVVLAQVVGWYWFFTGILNIVMIFIDRRKWGWKLTMGIIGIIAGLWIIQNPLIGTLGLAQAIVIILGIQGLVMGTVALIAGFQGGGFGSIVLGIVSIILGILLLTNIFTTALATPWVLSIFAVVGGIVEIFASFRQRSMQKAAA